MRHPQIHVFLLLVCLSALSCRNNDPTPANPRDAYLGLYHIDVESSSNENGQVQYIYSSDTGSVAQHPDTSNGIILTYFNRDYYFYLENNTLTEMPDDCCNWYQASFLSEDTYHLDGHGTSGTGSTIDISVDGYKMN